jgi:hypothetical protein
LGDDFKRRYDREREVLRNGPNGPPVYDDYRYRLDYEKVNKAMGRTARYRPSSTKMEKWLDKMKRE